MPGVFSADRFTLETLTPAVGSKVETILKKEPEYSAVMTGMRPV